jgi:drug/metabolite transporter (DMT)-like permease
VNQPQQMRMAPLDWMLLVALAWCWGGSFFFMVFIVAEIPVFTSVCFRVLLASVSLFIIARIMKLEIPCDPWLWVKLFFVGFYALTLPFSLITWAQIHVESSLVGILTTIIPLLTALVAHFLTKQENLSRRTVIGLVIGMVGAGVIIGPGALGGFSLTSLGQFALIGAFTCFAFANVTFRHFMFLHPVVMIAIMMAGATVWALPLTLMERAQWVWPSNTAIAALLALTFIGSTLAYLIYNKVIVRAGATNASQVTFIIPAVSVFLGMAFLGDSPHWTAFAGMFVIFIGLMIKGGRIPLLR